jgi:hypothetical protein
MRRLISSRTRVPSLPGARAGFSIAQAMTKSFGHQAQSISW